MQVKSNYLGKFFDVEVFEAMEEGESINIISHETLENIIYNEVDSGLNVICEYKALLITPDHSVFFCTIKDNTGRTVQAIGETTPATLETDIAKNFPVLTAAKRAFDRAAKLYLSLAVSGKVLSDAEVDLTAAATNNGTEVVNLEAEAAKAVAASQMDKTTNTAPSTSSAQSADPAVAARPTKSAATSAPAFTGDPGTVWCCVGKFKDKKMTIADVYRDSPSYIKWILDKYNASTPEQIACKEACGVFLARMNGGK